MSDRQLAVFLTRDPALRSERGVHESSSLSDPCCFRCDFRPSRVRFWAHHIKMARLSGFDPVEAARSVGNPREDRHMGRGGICGDGMRDELECIAVLGLLPERYTVDDCNDIIRDPESYAPKLCKWAVKE